MIKAAGVMHSGHISRWDVSKEGNRIIKRASKSSSACPDLIREYDKACIVADNWPNDAQVLIDGEWLSAHIPRPSLKEDSQRVSVSYPYAGEPVSPMVALKVFEAFHHIAGKKGLPVIALNDYLSGADEIYGGLANTLAEYHEMGLIGENECGRIIDAAKNFGKMALPVHGDPKSDHILRLGNAISVIDLERASVSNPSMDYAIFSMRAARAGDSALEGTIIAESMAKPDNDENIFHAHRINYVLTEIYNTVFKEHAGLTSINLIPRRKDLEFTRMLQAIGSDFKSLGVDPAVSSYISRHVSREIRRKYVACV